MNGAIAAWPLAALWAVFAVSATGVWIAGSALARIADEVAERTGLGRTLAGLLFLAVATSLPEIATTLTGALRHEAELVTGNLFGGVALQTTILAVADLWARGPITAYPRGANHVLEGGALIALMSVVLVALLAGEPWSAGAVGGGAILAGLAYAGAVLLLRRHASEGDWVTVDLPEPLPSRESAPSEEARSTGALLWLSVACCLAILVLGLTLVAVAVPLASASGLGTGLLGVTLLAAVTSLPELTTTIAAVRMGAHELAISNVFGSNLVMLALVLPADLLYAPAPILREAGALAPLSIAFGILVTAIYVIGLTLRRKPRIGRLGVDSVAVIACYAVSLAVFVALR